jgi:hypothetical protein
MVSAWSWHVARFERGGAISVLFLLWTGGPTGRRRSRSSCFDRVAYTLGDGGLRTKTKHGRACHVRPAKVACVDWANFLHGSSLDRGLEMAVLQTAVGASRRSPWRSSCDPNGQLVIAKRRTDRPAAPLSFRHRASPNISRWPGPRSLERASQEAGMCLSSPPVLPEPAWHHEAARALTRQSRMSATPVSSILKLACLGTAAFRRLRGPSNCDGPADRRAHCTKLLPPPNPVMRKVTGINRHGSAGGRSDPMWVNSAQIPCNATLAVCSR